VTKLVEAAVEVVWKYSRMNEINKMLAVSKRNSGGVFRKYNC
jgi:hypothetical protein